MLYATGVITIEKIQDAKAENQAIKLPLAINPSTSKQSSRHTAFGDLGWGSPTRAYLQSINKLDAHVIHTIMDEAKMFMKASQRDTAGADDNCAQLAEGSGFSSD